MAMEHRLWVLAALCYFACISETIDAKAMHNDGALQKAKCLGSGNNGTMVLESTEVRYHGFNYSTSRRKLGDFHECAPCTCCTDETRKFCFFTVCCYSINCSLQRVPYGLCSFTPVSCNCFGCS